MLAFLFVWQILFAGPLEIASGNIGLVQYLQVFWPTMSPLEMKLLAAGICVFLIFALYRRIGDIARIMAWLWGAMLVTTGWVIVTGLLNFNAPLAFDLPADAWRIDWSFFQGLGEGSAEGALPLLGLLPGLLLGRGGARSGAHHSSRGCVFRAGGPRRSTSSSRSRSSASCLGPRRWSRSSLGATFVERVYGEWAAQLLAGMIVVTAFASIFALLLGYSRVPYAAAKDGVFFRWLGELHATKHFSAPLVAADRRRRHHRQLLQLGERHQSADGGANPDPGSSDTRSRCS